MVYSEKEGGREETALFFFSREKKIHTNIEKKYSVEVINYIIVPNI